MRVSAYQTLDWNIEIMLGAAPVLAYAGRVNVPMGGPHDET
jgi:hypothetical protein